jgi:predicted ester cyclase
LFDEVVPAIARLPDAEGDRAVATEDRAACERLLHRYVQELLNEGKDDLFGEFFHPDFQHDTDESALGFENTDADLDGIQAGMAEMREKLAPTYAATITRWDGDAVYLEWTFSGIHQGTVMGLEATHKPFSITYPGWTQFRDGKIYRARSDWDPEATLVAVKQQIYGADA